MNSNHKMLLREFSIGAAVMAAVALSAPALTTRASIPTNQNVSTLNSSTKVQSGHYTKDNSEDNYQFDWSLSDDGTLTLSNASFVFGGNNSPINSHISNQLPADVVSAVKKIVLTGSPVASGNIQYLFCHFANVENIDVHNLNVSGVTSMQALFCENQKLDSVNISSWDTSNVSNMATMFWEDPITTITGLNDLKTGQVTDMHELFATSNSADNSKVTQLAQSFINTADVHSVKNFEGLFDNSNMINLDISSWHMDAATDTSNMFGDYQIALQSPLVSYTGSKMTTLTLGPDDKFVPVSEPTAVVAPTFNPFGSTQTYVPVSLPSGTTINMPVDKSGNWEAVGSGTVTNPQGATWTSADFDTKYAPTATPRPAKETYVWKHTAPKLNINLKSPVTLKQGAKFDADSYFVSLTDAGENAISAPITSLKDAEALGMTISGADKVNTKVPGTYNVTFKLGSQSATLKVTIPGSSSNGGNSSNSSSSTTPASTAPSTNNSWNPTTPNQPNGNTGLPNYAAVKGDAVYATKAIYMYSSPNFTKHNRIAKYTKKTRATRPMFVVTGYDKSNGGALRYKVRDVNKGSKTYGKSGYVTANNKYVGGAYYQTMPKNKKLTVIAKHGINSYRSASLTGKSKHYKKGARLHVKKLVKHNLTTRYQLTNGHYVTGNKKFVIQGNY